MTRLRIRVLIPLLSFLSACASTGGTFAPLGPEHPASAEAAEVPITDPSAVLRGDAAELAAPLPVTKEHPSLAYVCPMHSDVTASAPGRCPKCGMQLVPRVETKGEEHHHEH